MSTDNNIRCYIVRIGGMPDPETVSTHHTAQAAAKAYQECQKKPEDGTRYVMKVRNKHGEWPDKPLRLNEDDDTETIVRLINEASQSPY